MSRDPGLNTSDENFRSGIPKALRFQGYQRLLDELDSGACDPKACMAVYLAEFISSGILAFKHGVILFDRGQHFPLGLMSLQHLEQIKGADYLSEQLSLEKLDLIKLFPGELLQALNNLRLCGVTSDVLWLRLTESHVRGLQETFVPTT